MNCKDCNNLILREEAKRNKCRCDSCAGLKTSKVKVSHDLVTSFSGKGRRGFVQWLKKGNFLRSLYDDAAVHRHNDRCEVIAMMIGDKNHDRMLEGFVEVVLGIARTES